MENTRYVKPIYDPFEVFKPSKTYLKQIIQELKRQSYELLSSNHELRYENGFDEILLPELDKRKKVLLRRISQYKFRLSGEVPSDDITSDDVSRAKQYLIESLYTATLRRKGKTLVGLCPFHQEKTGSFTIYRDNNRFTCFGCQEQGDSIDFVQKTQGLDFIEAVKYILHL